MNLPTGKREKTRLMLVAALYYIESAVNLVGEDSAEGEDLQSAYATVDSIFNENFGFEEEVE